MGFSNVKMAALAEPLGLERGKDGDGFASERRFASNVPGEPERNVRAASSEGRNLIIAGI